MRHRACLSSAGAVHHLVAGAGDGRIPFPPHAVAVEPPLGQAPVALRRDPWAAGGRGADLRPAAGLWGRLPLLPRDRHGRHRGGGRLVAGSRRASPREEAVGARPGNAGARRRAPLEIQRALRREERGYPSLAAPVGGASRAAARNRHHRRVHGLHLLALPQPASRADAGHCPLRRQGARAPEVCPVQLPRVGEHGAGPVLRGGAGKRTR